MSRRYSGLARLFHWVLVPVLWGMFLFGKYLENAEPSLSNYHLWSWHKSAGLGAFALIVMRIAWRLGHVPPHHEDLPTLQKNAAGAMHAALYLLMILTPLFGWIASSASGLPISFFGLPVPLIGPEGKAAEVLFFALHGASATALVGLSMAHMVAALHHHFVRGNDVLRRMLP